MSRGLAVGGTRALSFLTRSLGLPICLPNTPRATGPVKADGEPRTLAGQLGRVAQGAGGTDWAFWNVKDSGSSLPRPGGGLWERGFFSF